MTSATTTTTLGLSAVLRALMIVLLIALVVPAFAMADDASGAVLDQPTVESPPPADPPVAETTPPADPPVVADPAPTTSADPTPPVDTLPVETQPVDPPPVYEPAPQPTTPPATTTPDSVVVVDPPAVEPPAEVVPVPAPVVTLPVVDAIVTTLPELVATPATPPDDTAAKLLPVVVIPAALADAVPTGRLAASSISGPVAPTTLPLTLATGTDTPSQRAGVALAGAPAKPSAATLSGLLTSNAALPQDIFTLDPNHQRALAGVPATIERAKGMPLAGRIAEPTLFADTAVAAVGGSIQSGSSLLAVLAGYVLPGVGGPPATTIIMFMLVGLIVGLAHAPRPQLSERLHLGGLLGTRSGHGLAVCRPG